MAVHTLLDMELKNLKLWKLNSGVNKKAKTEKRTKQNQSNPIDGTLLYRRGSLRQTKYVKIEEKQWLKTKWLCTHCLIRK